MAHSITRLCPSRNRVSSWMLQDPRRCTGTSRIPFQSQNLRNRIARQFSLNDLVPPSLLMYDMTTVFSHIRHTNQNFSWGRNPVTLRYTASISNRFMCWLAYVPCSVWEPSCAPQPWLEASMERVMSVPRVISETAWNTAGEAHQVTWWRIVRVPSSWDPWTVKTSLSDQKPAETAHHHSSRQCHHLCHQKQLQQPHQLLWSQQASIYQQEHMSWAVHECGFRSLDLGKLSHPPCAPQSWQVQS